MAQAVSPLARTSESQVLKMISHGAPMREVLNELCNFVDTKSPGVIATVLLLDQDGTHLRLAAGPKVPKIWNKAFGSLKVPLNLGIQTATARLGNGIPVADVKSDPSFAMCWGLARQHGVQAAWATPIMSKSGKILGTVIFFHSTPQAPTEQELEVMEQAIHMAAIAIESDRHAQELRDFSRVLYQSHDEERRRIARELHDSTGQKVAALSINLALVKDASIFRPSKIEKLIKECESLAGAISEELRTLSYLLHPPMLDECGLNLAIQCYVEGINQRDHLKVSVEIAEGSRRLTEEAELALFRVVQASLTNVRLHSGASEAKIRIEHNMDGTVVAISDNGTGIPTGVMHRASKAKSIGIGISGMRERVEQLGGTLEIESSKSGTCVKATVPNHHLRVVTAAAAAGMAC